MAKTWKEILKIKDITDFKLEKEKMLAEKGMTYGQFVGTQEWKEAYREAAEYRFTSPEPFLPDMQK